MKTTLFTLAILLGSAFQINAQQDPIKNDFPHDPIPIAGSIEQAEDVKELDFSFYPNPAEDQISIVTNNKYDFIQVIDLTGTSLIESPFRMTPLLISDLKSGSYIVVLHADGKVIRKRLEKN